MDTLKRIWSWRLLIWELSQEQKQVERNWSDLPPNIIFTIFSKLDAVEILSSTQFVCSRWFRVAKDPLLFQSILVPELWCTAGLLYNVVDKCTSLKSLGITSCHLIPKADLVEACKTLPQLEHLQLNDAISISKPHKFLKQVGRCCSQLNDFGFDHMVDYPTCYYAKLAIGIARNMPHLRALRLSLCMLTTKGLRAILLGCPNLQHLDIQNCGCLDVREDVLKQCVARIPDLKLPCVEHRIVRKSMLAPVGSLPPTPRTDDGCSTSSSSSSSRRKSIHLNGVDPLQQLKVEEERDWADLPCDILFLIFLKLGAFEILSRTRFVCSLWFRLAKDPHLFSSILVPEACCTAKLLRNVVKNFCALKSLQLASCFQIPKDILVEACKKLPLLEDLQLCRATRISKPAGFFMQISRGCPQLKFFGFDHTPNHGKLYDDKVALAIARHMPQLRGLRLSMRILSTEGLQAILHGCPNLEHLDVRGCGNVDVHGDLLKECVATFPDLKLPPPNTSEDDPIHLVYLVRGNDFEQYLKQLVKTADTLIKVLRNEQWKQIPKVNWKEPSEFAYSYIYFYVCRVRACFDCVFRAQFNVDIMNTRCRIPGTRLFHDVLNPTHVPLESANNQTFGTFFNPRMRVFPDNSLPDYSATFILKVKPLLVPMSENSPFWMD